MALTQLGVVLVAGLLVDRFQPHRVLALPMCAMATACLLARAGGLGPWPFLYAGTLGVALGSFQAANVAAWAHYFGRTHLGEIRGLTFVITIAGAALGPLPFGWAAEHGGYGPVLLAGAVACVAVALVNLIAPSLRTPVAKRRAPRGPRCPPKPLQSAELAGLDQVNEDFHSAVLRTVVFASSPIRIWSPSMTTSGQ